MHAIFFYTRKSGGVAQANSTRQYSLIFSQNKRVVWGSQVRPPSVSTKHNVEVIDR